MEISIYFHIPFCNRRCDYCDFNTYAGLERQIPEYVKALNRELEMVLNNAPTDFKVTTIYFGGGTPSLLNSADYATLFTTIGNSAVVSPDAEISLEANPDSLSDEKITAYRQVGFNRISIGMQSASRFDLKALGRAHTNPSLLASVDGCRRAGFQHINLDLIFGIPGQTLESWQRTLRLALELSADHLSLYSLVIEEGTRLRRLYDKGLLVEVNDDLAADMYETAMEELAQAGYSQYEISNWAKNSDARCRHNLQYWRYAPYLGFGAGAHGFWGSTRTENLHTIQEYMQAVNLKSPAAFPAGCACQSTITMNRWEMMQENLMVSLRLTEEGVSLSRFAERYGVELMEVFPHQLEKTLREGLIEYDEEKDRLRLTYRGRLFGNRVFSQFVSNKVPKGYEHLLAQ